MRRVIFILIFTSLSLSIFAVLPNSLMGVTLGESKEQVWNNFQREGVEIYDVSDESSDCYGIYLHTPQVLFGYQCNMIFVGFSRQGKVVTVFYYNKDEDKSKYLDTSGKLWRTITTKYPNMYDEERSADLLSIIPQSKIVWVVTERTANRELGIITLKSRKVDIYMGAIDK